MTTYRKAIGAFLTGALAWATAVVASDSTSITAEEWIGLVGILVTTIVVYFLTNEPAVDG
jgi:FtsH-binding integral membrane protein